MIMSVRPMLVSASQDATIRFWDLSTQKQLEVVPHKESQVNCLAISPDANQVAAAGWEKLRVYDASAPSAHSSTTFQVHEKNVTTLGYQSEGIWIYSGGEDGMAKIWDMRAGLTCQRIFQVTTPVACVALHPNQIELIVSDSTGALYLWDLRSDRDDSLVTEVDLSEYVAHVELDQTGRQCAAVTNRGHLFMWNIHSGTLAYAKEAEAERFPKFAGLDSQPAHVNGVNDADNAAFALPPIDDLMPPFGLSTVPEDTPYTVMSNVRPSAMIKAHDKFALKCHFTPDGLTVGTTASDGTTKLWSATDCKPKRTFQIPSKKWVWDCAFTNDSKYMLTASSDALIRMWDVNSGQEVRTYQGHSMSITAMAFRDISYWNALMFSRKPKSSDVQSSLHRFLDFGRDPSSRAKHFRNVFEALNEDERKQFCNDYSFEVFHLIESLLSNIELAVDAQGVVEAESALWALEQLLCYVPDLVGRGWQKNGIEHILKRGLHPSNMIAVRKISIRLFLCWYQALNAYGNAPGYLDGVFQSLLPYFPLRDKKNTIRVLMLYCEGPPQGQAPGFNPISAQVTPIVQNPTPIDQLNMRERAQNLQVYLDKFLEYSHREVVKLRWNNPAYTEKCANLMFHKIAELYVGEVFADFNNDLTDLFGDRDAEETRAEVLDTADPLVIARYWLIRWITNIASAAFAEEQVPALLLFRKYLYSTEANTNLLFMLMRKAMVLPLACSSVIQKVIALMRTWLSNTEVPPSLQSSWSGRPVKKERISTLLIGFLFSFFQSPYIPQCGDRLQAVLSITQTILEIIRDLLQTNQSEDVWVFLLHQLAATTQLAHDLNVYDYETTMSFVRVLLTTLVDVTIAKRVEIPAKLWDQIALLFQRCRSAEVLESWSQSVDVLTYVMALNVLDVELDAELLHPIVAKCLEHEPVTRKNSIVPRQDDAAAHLPRTEPPVEFTRLIQLRTGPTSAEASVEAAAATKRRWLHCWMRLLCLEPVERAEAVQTLGRQIEALCRSEPPPAARALVHWAGGRLLTASPANDNAAVLPLARVLNEASPPDPLRAQILARFIDALHRDAPIKVLEQFANMNVEDIATMSMDTIRVLQKLVLDAEFSDKAVKVAAVLALNNREAEEILLTLLRNNKLRLDLDSLTTIVNAFSVIALERADFGAATQVLQLLTQRTEFAAVLLAQFCSNLTNTAKLAFQTRVASALDQALAKSIQTREDRLTNEIKWQMVSLWAREKPANSLKPLLANVAAMHDEFFEGFLVQRALQYPLPGFAVSQWNSSLPSSSSDLKAGAFVKTSRALLSFERHDDEAFVWSRTVVGRHCYSLRKLNGIPPRQTSTQDWLSNLKFDQKESRRSTSAKESEEKAQEFIDELVPSADPSIELSTSSLGVKPTTSISPVNVNSVLQYLRNKRRSPLGLATKEPDSLDENLRPSNRLQGNSDEWRLFLADMNFIGSVEAPQSEQSFARDLRHLDQTCSREVHKIALIYVGIGQEDKQSILANTHATPIFDQFVERLGWPVEIGPGHVGYAGGLPAGHVAPYFANSQCELIFHVSTRLPGDVTQKLKHLGNDEVHVIWTEHTRPYRREMIATRFCDVLIVLQPVATSLIRVRVETQQDIHFGPLFDGAQVHVEQLPELVRETVMNASRIYRMRQKQVPRPNKHREHVFTETAEKLSPVPIAQAITSAYIPSLKA